MPSQFEINHPDSGDERTCLFIEALLSLIRCHVTECAFRVCDHKRLAFTSNANPDALRDITKNVFNELKDVKARTNYQLSILFLIGTLRAFNKVPILEPEE
jgi:hypothetical protein